MAWRGTATTSTGVINVTTDKWDVFPSGNNYNEPYGQIRDISFDVTCLTSFDLTLTNDLDDNRESIDVKVYATVEGTETQVMPTLNVIWIPGGPQTTSLTSSYSFPSDTYSVRLETTFICYSPTATFVTLEITNVVECTTTSTSTSTSTPPPTTTLPPTTLPPTSTTTTTTTTTTCCPWPEPLPFLPTPPYNNPTTKIVLPVTQLLTTPPPITLFHGILTSTTPPPTTSTTSSTTNTPSTIKYTHCESSCNALKF